MTRSPKVHRDPPTSPPHLSHGGRSVSGLWLMLAVVLLLVGSSIAAPSGAPETPSLGTSVDAEASRAWLTAATPEGTGRALRGAPLPRPEQAGTGIETRSWPRPGDSGLGRADSAEARQERDLSRWQLVPELPGEHSGAP